MEQGPGFWVSVLDELRSEEGKIKNEKEEGAHAFCFG